MSVPLDDLPKRLREAPPSIVVVGEVILDRWVHGEVERVSREAPVPVVEAGDTRDCAGGAANTAVNLAALGVRVRLVSAVGDDAEGSILRELLTRAGVDVAGVTVASGATSCKTRVVAGDQILVRVDRAGALPSETARTIAEAVTAEDVDAVLVCDYGAGLLDPAGIAARLPEPRTYPVVVDAHDIRRWAVLHPDVVTPNAAETAALLGAALPVRERPRAVGERAAQILAAAHAAAAIVTLDRDGAVVLEPGRAPARTSTVPAPDARTTGAGDTFAAALTAALAVGADLGAAARLAQRAADVVVARPGTAVCRLADLVGDGATADIRSPAVVSPDRLAELVAAERARGRRVVFTNGCFDVLHPGHTAHLRQARSLGDLLVVALNDDASVARLKGPDRPVNPLADRAAVLAELECVDHVTVFTEDSPVALLERLRPEVYAKGGDYTPEMLAETAVVEGYGGEVRILDWVPDHSTSAIVDRITARAAGR